MNFIKSNDFYIISTVKSEGTKCHPHDSVSASDFSQALINELHSTYIKTPTNIVNRIEITKTLNKAQIEDSYYSSLDKSLILTPTCILL